MSKDKINNLPEHGTAANKAVAIEIMNRNISKKEIEKQKYIKENIYGNMELPEDN